MFKYLILSIFIAPIFVSGQHTIYKVHNRILSFDNQNFHDLNQNGELVDQVRVDGQFVYAKRKLSDTKEEEYFKVNDTLYYYRQLTNGEFTANGSFYIDLHESVKSDSIYIACSYGQYEDEIHINHFFKPLKTKYWFERNENNEKIRGIYKDGLKEGNWDRVISDSKSEQIKYSAGDTIGIFNPTHLQMQQQEHLLKDRIFKMYHYSKDQKIEKKGFWKFVVAANYPSQFFVELRFLDDKKVELAYSLDEEKQHIDQGIYTYEFLPPNEMQFIKSGKEIMSMKVDYFGSDQLEGNVRLFPSDR